MDSNHGEIVAALRKVGCAVLSLAAIGDGAPDLLVRAPGQGDLLLMEVKAAKGKLNARQREFEAEGWPVFTVRSVEDALKLVIG